MPVGVRRRGGPINYADDMELYRAWHTWRAEGKSTQAFLRALSNPLDPRIRLNRWPQPVTYDASKKALSRARSWLRPARDVPPSVSDFIAATPGT